MMVMIMIVVVIVWRCTYRCLVQDNPELTLWLCKPNSRLLKTHATTYPGTVIP